MARSTLLRRGAKRRCCVTIRAGGGSVRAREGKRRPFVRKPCAPPKRRHLMALLAVRRKASERVIGIRRASVIRTVTAGADGRRPRKLLLRRVSVAALACERCVLAQQRKARQLMLLHHVPHPPIVRRVTACTACAQLAAMDIRVTGEAIR